MKALRTRIALFLLTLCFVHEPVAQEWTRFRGPNGSGMGQGKNLPSNWKAGQELWRVQLPATGHSSPVLWGDRIFITSSEGAGGRFIVSSLKADSGAAAWQKEFPTPSYTRNPNNSFASASPAADAQHVFVLRVDSGQLVLTALTHAGELAWEFKAGIFKTEHGLGHSPIVYEDRVVVSDDQDLAGRVLALEASTGRLLWEAPRSPGRADYSTPCLFQTKDNATWLIFNSMEDGICALNVKDGALAWKANKVLDKRSVSSPVLAAGLVTASCGSGAGGNYVVALRPPERPGQEPSVAYEVRHSAPYVPTPVALGDLLFLWSDGGVVTCVNAVTGATHWQERVGGNYFSSPICVDGKLYNTSTSGEVVVLAPSKTFKELGRSSLGEGTHATAAVAHGRIYFRTFNQVLAIGPVQ